MLVSTAMAGRGVAKNGRATRDIAYGLENWENTLGDYLNLGVNLIALLPVIGAFKNLGKPATDAASHVAKQIDDEVANLRAIGANNRSAPDFHNNISQRQPGGYLRASRGVGRFPAEPDDLTRTLGVEPKISTTQHGTKRYLWEPNSNTRIRFESHPGDAGTFNPRHHGEHYHIEIKPPNLSWNQAKRQGLITKVRPEDYIPGHGTGHLPGEPFPGQ